MKRSRSIYLVSIIAFSLVFISACKMEHKVDVETNKPIKIEARIDIYLHAESIEDMVSGKAPVPEASNTNNKESFLKRLIVSLESSAYADGVPIKDFTEQIREIILRRKNRFSAIEQLIKAGKASEGPKAYIVPGSGLNAEEKKLIDEENTDRKSLYEELAKQNNTTLGEVEKAFAKVHKGK